MVVLNKVGAEKPTGILSRIRPIGFDADEGIHINVYGRSGSGKTTFWATFPKPILVAVCSGSSKTGELRSIDTPQYRKTISQIVIDTSTDLSAVVQYQKQTGKYKTFVLDHVSGFQDLLLTEVVGLPEIPAQLSWGLATQQQYGQVALQAKTYLRALFSLQCNIVVVAQEREFNTDGDSELLKPYVASALTPSIAGWLYPACDYMVQTFLRNKTITDIKRVGGKEVKLTRPTKEVEYCLRTGPDSVYATKFRLPKGTPLPDCIVDPSYEKVMELIQGGK